MKLDLFENDSIYDEVMNTEFYKKYYLTLMRGNTSPVTGKMNFRMERTPVDTWLPLHNEINKRSNDVIGLPIRNLLIASNDGDQVKEYGLPMYIIPLDGYRLFHVDSIYDMTDDLKFYDYKVKNDLITVINTFYHKNGQDGTPMKIVNKVELMVENNPDKPLDTVIEVFKHILSDEIGDDLGIGDMTEFKKDLVDMFNESFKSKIDLYINNIKEITTKQEFDDHVGEIMVYAPNGFYAVTMKDALDNIISNQP